MDFLFGLLDFAFAFDFRFGLLALDLLFGLLDLDLEGFRPLTPEIFDRGLLDFLLDLDLDFLFDLDLDFLFDLDLDLRFGDFLLDLDLRLEVFDRGLLDFLLDGLGDFLLVFTLILGLRVFGVFGATFTLISGYTGESGFCPRYLNLLKSPMTCRQELISLNNSAVSGFLSG